MRRSEAPPTSREPDTDQPKPGVAVFAFAVYFLVVAIVFVGVGGWLATAFSVLSPPPF